MEYNFREIEKNWKKYWNDQQVYKVETDTSKPKFYILDMFPYPSGAGLHVGHPLGYIASDIYARYKRLSGFNVLHPMGYDAFGLPAEQYALETGQHPSVTTEKNIARYREQMDNIGFCYDWSREVRTSDAHYYKWTQWIFLQLFKSWYDRKENKARSIDDLIAIFKQEGNTNVPCPGDSEIAFDAASWNAYTEKEQHDILMNYRLAYCGYGEVNWCEALGTVLANDEVVNGVSERGGHPVVKKKLRQWYLRITEYADRLLNSLDNLEWTEAMKEMQRNWIGKSQGAQIQFSIPNSPLKVEVFTTRPDTIFGVDFMVVAPEHDLVDQITTEDNKKAVADYKEYVQSRSERERMTEVKQVTGAFTGAYVTHPFTQKQIPVWISEYVLAGYGTGAIMAVPSGDDRDFKFAQHFNIPVTNIFGEAFTGEEAFSSKEAILSNSDFLNGLSIPEAVEAVINKLEDMHIGSGKINFRLRDAAFSRQRYWGEPFPIKWIDGMAVPLSEDQLPLELPVVEKYTPGPEGEGPLANLPEWADQHLETNTMPGYAGSSWYFLRYMDPHNNETFASRKATDYWNQVDVYVGGTEHAVGHLLYSRMWTKALCDLGHIGFDEPFKKLVNQGMIQGSSRFVYRVHGTNTFVSQGLIDQYPTNELHVDVNICDGVELDTEAFKNWRPEYANAEFVLEDGKYICGSVVEKMSKSKYNVVNPDVIVDQYGADTFRMYEMFLGPIDQSKPWDTKGIEGVHRFIKKLWRLFADEQNGWIVEETPATDAELRIIHKTIKKISEDIERFSFNTCISQLMICVNDLTAANCHKREVLEKLAILIGPFAPHLSEELWHKLGNETSAVSAQFPVYEEKYVVDNSKVYPVAVNGKTRTELEFPLDIDPKALEAAVLADETVIKWLEGKTPKKVIYVKGRMINIVV